MTQESFIINFKKKFPPLKIAQLMFLLSLPIFLPESIFGQEDSTSFRWPKGKQFAISLTFDDARVTQVDVGTAILNQYGVKATFLVVPSGVEERLQGWKKAVADGHEIGNHTLLHPCSVNFRWHRKALEDYSIEEMRDEIIIANKKIQELLGVKPTVFAFPCGSTFVGRGITTKSYVPLIAKLFLAGRGWLDEGPNDPASCDLAQLTGMEMDRKDFEQILPIVENARKAGAWLVLAGHEMGDSGQDNTRTSMLKKLIEYAQDPINEIWIAPMGTVAKYIKDNRKLQ